MQKSKPAYRRCNFLADKITARGIYMLRLGFVGFGEAGYNLTKNMLHDKVDLFAFDIESLRQTERGTLIRQHAEENGVTLVNSMENLAKAVEVFFCFTSAASAYPIAEQMAPLLSEDQIYVDMNSTSPSVKERIGEMFVRSSHGSFVEAAVMSSVPTGKTKVPIKLCGAKAEQLSNRLNEIGMNVTALDVKIGKASAIKMLKSILSKGIIAVVTEAVFCTEKYGITDIVLNGEKSFLDELGFIEYCNHDVTQAAAHNERFFYEMKEVLATVESMGENAIMTRAAMEKFLWMSEKGFGKVFNERPNSYHEVIEAKERLN